jgi:hypothetical protein
MRSTIRALSVALAATFLLAACGSDDSGSGAESGSSTDTAVETTDMTADTTPASTDAATPETTEAATSTTPETTEPAEPAQDVEADTAAAQAAVVVVADVPEGWSETPRPSEAASLLESRLAECVGVEGDRITAAEATAASALLASPDGTIVVTQDIGVLATERDARSVVAFLVEPDVPTCFQAAYDELAAEALAGTVADSASFGPAVATRLQVGSAGDATQAVRVVVPVVGDPSTVAVTVDHVVVRAGRSLASLTFENRTGETPVETIDELTAIAASRLAI